MLWKRVQRQKVVRGIHSKVFSVDCHAVWIVVCGEHHLEAEIPTCHMHGTYARTQIHDSQRTFHPRRTRAVCARESRERFYSDGVRIWVSCGLHMWVWVRKKRGGTIKRDILYIG